MFSRGLKQMEILLVGHSGSETVPKTASVAAGSFWHRRTR